MTDDHEPGTAERGEGEEGRSASPETPASSETPLPPETPLSPETPPSSGTPASSETAAAPWPPPTSPPSPQWPPPFPSPAPDASGAPGLGGPSDRPDPLLVELPDRAKQRRWTVLIRLILVIPLLVVTVVVGIAMVVCAVIGWFAALIMGRAPEFLRTIVTVFVRLDLRLHAYGLLLTDRFPPFSLDERPDYRVALLVPPATRLNRAAVLFRFILAIPANILLSLLQYGSYVFAIIGWVATLITGWLPQTFHDAFRAYLRYQARVVGYFFLATPTYPDGLFGDESAQLAPPGQPSLPVVERPDEVPSGPSPSWRLVLGTGAKRVLAVIIIVGIPVAIVSGIERNSVFNSSVQSSNQQALVAANNQLVGDFNQFASSAKSCTTVSCLEQANGVLSGQLASFVSAVQAAGDAGVNPDAVNQVIQAAQNAEQSTAAMADAGSTVNAYQQAAARVQLVQRLNALGTAQERFATAINNA